MRKFFLSLSLAILSLPALAQVDYLEIRHIFTESCGRIDSVSLLDNQAFMDSVMQMEIINGEEEFLFDYAWTYYRRYMFWKKDEDLKLSIKYNEQCWEKYQNTNALWNLAGNYKSIGNCDKALELTELYIVEMKKENEAGIDYEQVYLRYKFCR